ncbi:MAG: phosphoribosylglycinamide formyltransferase [Gammaproteobacteria bacterium]
MSRSNPESPLRVVALISGRGSNLQALIDEAAAGRIPASIVAVISNRSDAVGLTRAQRAGIATAVVDHREFPDRETYDTALQKVIDRYDPDLVVLAGFMRILSDPFVAHYAGRMMNIHPSLLPKYRGLHTHERAIEAGDHVSGATVHFVTSELDGGPIIVQTQVPVLADDTPDTLAARVLAQEHRIYPLAVKWFAEGRLGLDNNRVILDGLPLRSAPVFEE